MIFFVVFKVVDLVGFVDFEVFFLGLGFLLMVFVVVVKGFVGRRFFVDCFLLVCLLGLIFGWLVMVFKLWLELFRLFGR